MIDARGKDLDFSALAVALCQRSGADGFMAVDNSDKADFKLHFYNAVSSRRVTFRTRPSVGLATSQSRTMG